jgi:dipeptidyl aminopeptidase/acylaminoacyl peptidase
MARPGYEADRYDVRARNWPDGEARRVAPAWDRSPGELSFSGDGKRLWATADDLGQVPIFSIDAASGKVAALPGKGASTWVGEARERIVWLRNDLEHPDELWTSAPDGSDARVLVNVNTDRLQGVRFGKPEQIEFRGAGGDTVRAYFLEPVGGPKPGTPLVLLVHGGPQGSMANRWHDRWNAQVYAGAGFAVLMVDFHGSTGYGQAFTDAIRGDWGGKPLADLDAGLAAVAQRYPWVAVDRACALGASYGGYMVNWIAGQRPERFRCLVNHDGLFDMRSMYYATEELWFPEWEQQGTYFEAAARHERHNPASHVQRWKTPMLVIHGSLDYRVNVEQGLATFTALQRRGVPSRFVHFPDENHWVLHAANSLQWHEEVLGWLAKYLTN